MKNTLEKKLKISSMKNRLEKLQPGKIKSENWKKKTKKNTTELLFTVMWGIIRTA